MKPLNVATIISSGSIVEIEKNAVIYSAIFVIDHFWVNLLIPAFAC